MTAPTLAPLVPAETATAAPRPGSRAARMALPRAIDTLKQLATDHGVCTRPVLLRRTNLTTGLTEVVELPCGATREDKCPACATRAKRLRQVQIREGWHRTSEPAPGPDPATPQQRALIELRAHLELERAQAELTSRWERVAEIDQAITEAEHAISAEGLRGTLTPHAGADDDQGDAPRRVRSTKRREDVPDLPRRRVEPRTVGRVYTAPDGATYQPSMWLTLTLDSYGPVHAVRRASGGKPIPCACKRVHADDDPVIGTPVDPDRYDYRRAAWDAVHFPRLLDRFWQNLRRAEGWNVQYAGCVEPQRRLAPHAHFAIRGTIPRAMLLTVAAATYHQVWWPAAGELVYQPDRAPVWDPDRTGWVDPDTRAPLAAWVDALDALDADPDATPAHVVRFGEQVNAKGVNGGTRDAERTIGYITKYLTKNAADCHAETTDPQRRHADRLWRQLRVTPCSDRCANWLLYGIQPKNAHDKLRPGNCKSKVHQRSTLGIGGRRILVSRDWSGKTLADHRADAHAWVKSLLGITDTPDPDDPEQAAPVAWELARPDDPDVPPLQHRILRAVAQRIQRRQQLDAARQLAGTGPPGHQTAGESGGAHG
ncbi:replication initiator [Asanoa siamensis]|uniref:Replication initiator protein n=1 Tax=Asanoa siamensis TaxID=926357 RepID=A0ABQ4CI50_9ACTN|nr:replication initiator [Asanoa siamensis]GIF70981.1 hypothetical protein Asi02nite_04990 [Asanoa siamensis]